MLQLGLCVERTMATIYPASYESSQSCQGKSICILAIFASVIGAALMDLSSKNDEPVSSCLNNHKDNWVVVDISNYLLTAANLLTFFWACTLLSVNKIYKKRSVPQEHVDSRFIQAAFVIYHLECASTW
ncbi:hypothetical protein ANCCAN_11394 [Ancylostoma caninum]|uniref:Uncharacterized protein n=1 Tax=Ancylostoma caninum TaxID=29170 RepID=A0A368GH98_ANCCA|nr:hypothetical protein ANCCAN_11394 [Ancylostoma caninum]